MNRTLNYILVGGVSALIGAVAGYVFCKKQFENKIEDVISERINKELEILRKVKRSSTDITAPLEKHGDKEDVDIFYDEDDISYVQKVTELFDKMFPNYELNDYKRAIIENEFYNMFSNNCSISYNEVKDRFKKILTSFESPQDDIPEEDLGTSYDEDYNIQAVMDEYASRPPHVISPEEFAALPPAFDIMTYKYFDDDVLLDDGDEFITDVEKYVGDALVRFGTNLECPDSVYVLNGQYGCAIEIIRMHCAYVNWSGYH